MEIKSENGENQACTETANEAVSKKQQDMLMSLRQAEAKMTCLFEETLDAIDNLAQIRLKCKLSNSRVAGVYRELKELSKVMSVYK